VDVGVLPLLVDVLLPLVGMLPLIVEVAVVGIAECWVGVEQWVELG